MKIINLIIGVLLMAILVTADTAWTRPPATESESLWQQDGDDIYYYGGNVLVENDDLSVELLINNNRTGNGDALISFQTDDDTQMVICFDDSVNRLEFIMGNDCDDYAQAYFSSYGFTFSKGRLNYNIDTINPYDTTPSVAYGNFYSVRNSFTTTITNFDMGQTGQIIHILCMDLVTRLSDVGNLKLAGTFYCGSYDTITLINDGRDWVEISRSNN